MGHRSTEGDKFRGSCSLKMVIYMNRTKKYIDMLLVIDSKKTVIGPGENLVLKFCEQSRFQLRYERYFQVQLL